jgi:hypothetical protein
MGQPLADTLGISLGRFSQTFFGMGRAYQAQVQRPHFAFVCVAANRTCDGSMFLVLNMCMPYKFPGNGEGV